MDAGGAARLRGNRMPWWTSVMVATRAPARPTPGVDDVIGGEFDRFMMPPSARLCKRGDKTRPDNATAGTKDGAARSAAEASGGALSWGLRPPLPLRGTRHRLMLQVARTVMRGHGDGGREPAAGDPLSERELPSRGQGQDRGRRGRGGLAGRGAGGRRPAVRGRAASACRSSTSASQSGPTPGRDPERAGLRQWIEQKAWREGSWGAEFLEEPVAAFCADLAAVRERIPSWPQAGDFDVLLTGLRRTYKRARKAMRAASTHLLRRALPRLARKRVKYHRYHLELLAELWPRQVGGRRKEVKALGGRLGDEHDLAVLQATLAAADGRLGGDSAQSLLALAERRQAELRAVMRPAWAAPVCRGARGRWHAASRSYWRAGAHARPAMAAGSRLPEEPLRPYAPARFEYRIWGAAFPGPARAGPRAGKRRGLSVAGLSSTGSIPRSAAPPSRSSDCSACGAGLQHWLPALRCLLPLPATVIEGELGPALGVAPPPLARGELWPRALARRGGQRLASRAGRGAWSSDGAQFVVAGARAERTRVEVGAVTVESVAIEAEAFEAARRAVSELRLTRAPNLDYVAALRRLLAGDRLGSQPGAGDEPA